MLTLSEEQNRIILAAKRGSNVQVDAVAGAGKTSSILSLAREMPESYIFQITYNSSLKSEVIEKCKEQNLKNIEIFTYHSLGYKFYTEECATDLGIYKIIEEGLALRRPLEKRINIVVIDEAQDMTDLYFQFLIYFFKHVQDFNKRFCNKEEIDNKEYELQLIILGDKYQGLYDFKNADTRYLTFSHKIWQNMTSRPFEFISLATTYRLTKQVAAFVNTLMLGETRLLAIKDGPPVAYIKDRGYSYACKQILETIQRLIKQDRVKADEIFILAPSFKSKKALVNQIENGLVKMKIPCFVPISENSMLNNDVIKNKIAFTTFHQSKGRERKYVFLLNFDDMYFRYYAHSLDPFVCPATLYVAATRATYQLTVIDIGEFMLPFLKVNTYPELKNYPFVTYNREGFGLGKNPSIVDSLSQIMESDAHHTSPTELIKFISSKTLNKIYKIIERYNLFTEEEICPKDVKVTLTYGTNNNYNGINVFEEVCDINGTAIPALYECEHMKTCSIYDFVKQHYIELLPSDMRQQKIISNIVEKNEWQNLSLADHMLMTNYYKCLRRGYKCKLAQVISYDWLDPTDAERLIGNLKNHIPLARTKFEQTIIEQKRKPCAQPQKKKQVDENERIFKDRYKQMDDFMEEHFGYVVRFEAVIDADDGETIWEFKCVEEFQLEHKVQLIIYAWIWQLYCLSEFGPRNFKLMNITNGKVVTLKYDDRRIEEIMISIFQWKYKKFESVSNENFLRSCTSLFV
jgi:hypothetical protein